MIARIFLLFIGPFCFALLAAAGSIVLSEGQASIQRGGNTINASTGGNVEVGDVIVTGPGAKVKVRFEDGTVVTVGRDSRLSVNDFINTGRADSKMDIGISKGFFRAVTGAIGKVAPSRFKIKTNTTTIGIRGTTIVGEVHQNRDKIACANGAISVLSDQVGVYVVVSAGQVTEVELGRPPMPPRPYTAQEFNNMDPEKQDNGVVVPLNNVPASTRENLQDTTDAAADLKLTDDLEIQSEVLLDESITGDLIDNDLIPDDEILENLGSHTVGSDPYMSWGYWIEQNSEGQIDVTDPDNINDVWFEGTTTPTSYIDDLIEGTGTTSFTYSGSDVFGVAGGEFINSGNVQLKFDFGGNSASFDSANSYLQFSTDSDTWQVENLSGTVTGSGFSSSSFDTGAASTVNGISGNVKGNFFGSSAEEVGGSFDLSGGGKSATGGFTGSR